MKKRLFLVIACFSVLITASAFGQRDTSKVSINGKNIEVEYGTPSLQGRDMLGRLPVGGTWRMGMNAATTLKTDGDLSFGDQKVSAGEYRLTAKRVEENKWHLVISSDAGDVEVPLSPMDSEGPVETFKIWLTSEGGNAGNFKMAWGTLSVGADFAVH